MLAYLPHQLPKWGRKIDGRIATESPGGLKRNELANKNGINGRIRTDYAEIKGSIGYKGVSFHVTEGQKLILVQGDEL